MKIAPLHPQEEFRLASLNELSILDTLPEKEYDHITYLASQICQTPIALISLVDKDRQWFKSKVGLDVSQTPRDIAFCAHAILTEEPFIITDTKEDERFADHPLVTDGLKMRFYAGVPLVAPDGQPIGTVCAIDIKPKQLSEEQIKSMQALSSQVTELLRLRLQVKELKKNQNTLLINKVAFENISSGFMLKDRNNKIVDFNQAALDILELTEDQLKNDKADAPYYEAYKRDGSPFPPNEYPSTYCVQTGYAQHNVLKGIKTKTQKMKWIKLNSDPIYLLPGDLPSHSVTTFTDVTSEINFRDHLIKSQRELKFLIDSLPHFVAYFDQNLNNITSNLEFANYFKSTTESLKGKHLKDILGDKMFDLYKSHIDETLKGNTTSFESEITTDDGQVRNVFVSFFPDNSSADIKNYILLATDVTQIKLLEAEQRTLEIKLFESSRLSTLGEVAGGLAHEINNPLAIIRGYAANIKRLLKSPQPDVEGQIKNLEKIETTVDRIAKIIKGLRAYSRNAEADPLERVSIQQVFEDTLEICRERFKFHGIEIKHNLAPDLFVMGRDAQMSQIFMNLLTNSFDAIQDLEEKWIRVEFKKLEDKIRIEFVDSGKGIPPEVAKKIMVPFFTTKDVGKGTGLGLSISHGLAQSHGGALDYNPDSPNTMFILEFPNSADAKN